MTLFIDGNRFTDPNYCTFPTDFVDAESTVRSVNENSSGDEASLSWNPASGTLVSPLPVETGYDRGRLSSFSAFLSDIAQRDADIYDELRMREYHSPLSEGFIRVENGVEFGRYAIGLVRDVSEEFGTPYLLWNPQPSKYARTTATWILMLSGTEKMAVKTTDTVEWNDTEGFQRLVNAVVADTQDRTLIILRAMEDSPALSLASARYSRAKASRQYAAELDKSAVIQHTSLAKKMRATGTFGSPTGRRTGSTVRVFPVRLPSGKCPAVFVRAYTDQNHESVQELLASEDFGLHPVSVSLGNLSPRKFAKCSVWVRDAEAFNGGDLELADWLNESVKDILTLGRLPKGAVVV